MKKFFKVVLTLAIAGVAVAALVISLVNISSVSSLQKKTDKEETSTEDIKKKLSWEEINLKELMEKVNSQEDTLAQLDEYLQRGAIAPSAGAEVNEFVDRRATNIDRGVTNIDRRVTNLDRSVTNRYVQLISGGLWTDDGTYIYPDNVGTSFNITDTGNLTTPGSVSASSFAGDGSSLTSLNASQLLSGVAPSARLSGAYTGITGVGTLTSLTVSGTPVSMIRTASGQWLNMADGTDTFGVYNRAGTPETFIAANIGSLAIDTTNGTLYAKTTDTVATGWVQFGTAGSGAFSTTANVTSNAPGNMILDDLVFGSDSLDDDGDAKHERRMFFDKDKGAFRAGRVTGTEWDDVNRGNNSTAMGYNTIASGASSTAMGWNTTASGLYSTAMSRGTTASGNWATAMGQGTTASGSSSTAMGYNSTASGNFSTAMGMNTTAQPYASVVLGRYNVVSGTTDSWVATDPLFVIGNGTSGTPANAMTVLKNGDVGIGTASPAYDLDVNGDIRAIGSVYYGGTEGNPDGTPYTKPDFVFEEGYDVMSVEQVEEYLRVENHLPWMTSVKQEKEENGDVIDMTRMAFETVETAENLQLQIIGLNTMAGTQQEQISLLQSGIGEIETGVGQNNLAISDLGAIVSEQQTQAQGLGDLSELLAAQQKQIDSLASSEQNSELKESLDKLTSRMDKMEAQLLKVDSTSDNNNAEDQSKAEGEQTKIKSADSSEQNNELKTLLDKLVARVDALETKIVKNGSTANDTNKDYQSQIDAQQKQIDAQQKQIEELKAQNKTNP